MVVNKILNPGSQGDGLRLAFNQNQARSKPEAQEAPQATGLNQEDEHPESDKSFVSRYPDGNLYNTEVDKPVRDNPPMVNPGSNRRTQEKRINRVKLGDTLSFRGTEGVVVARANDYIKIADAEERVLTIPVSETFYKDDMMAVSNVEGQMWDMMQRDMRSAAMNKANMKDEDVQKAYLYRDWDDIPEDIQGILKEFNYYDGVPHGGVEGREPSHNDRNEESRSHRDVTQPRHVTAPYTDKQAPAFRKDKSDVEHGAYGGVVTDTPIDATDDYEDDRPGLGSKPLSGTETLVDQGPTGQTGAKRDVKTPKDLTEEPTDSKWNEEHKGEQQQAAITGKPDMKKQIGSYPSQAGSGNTTKQTHTPSTTPSSIAGTTKDEDRGVESQSQGWQGAKPNAQAAEKGEQQQAAITGKPDLREGDKEVEKEEGKTGPTFGDGPKHMDKAEEERNVMNKTQRWGPRQASLKEIEAFYAKQ